MTASLNNKNSYNCYTDNVKQLSNCKITTYQLEANSQQKFNSSIMSTILPGSHLYFDKNTTKTSKRKRMLFGLYEIACLGLTLYPVSTSKMNFKKSISFVAGAVGLLAGAIWSGYDAYKNAKGNKVDIIQNNEGQIINVCNSK